MPYEYDLGDFTEIGDGDTAIVSPIPSGFGEGGFGEGGFGGDGATVVISSGVTSWTDIETP